MTLQAGNTPLFEVRSGVVHYRSTPVLRVDSFMLAPGELAVIEGGNGTGKTSLLRSITGVRGAWFDGEMLFDGASLLALRTHRRILRGIRMIPQGNRMFGRLTEQQHSCLAERSLPSARTLEAPRWLSVRRQPTAAALSGGQARLSLLRALTCGRPRLVLADEPFAGLDEASLSLAIELLRRTFDEGAACVLVDHSGEGARLHQASQRYTIDLTGPLPLLRHVGTEVQGA